MHISIVCKVCCLSVGLSNSMNSLDISILCKLIRHFNEFSGHGSRVQVVLSQHRIRHFKYLISIFDEFMRPLHECPRPFNRAQAVLINMGMHCSLNSILFLNSFLDISIVCKLRCLNRRLDM